MNSAVQSEKSGVPVAAMAGDLPASHVAESRLPALDGIRGVAVLDGTGVSFLAISVPISGGDPTAIAPAVFGSGQQRNPIGSLRVKHHCCRALFF